jgi:hypothetical protein
VKVPLHFHPVPDHLAGARGVWTQTRRAAIFTSVSAEIVYNITCDNIGRLYRLIDLYLVSGGTPANATIVTVFAR